MVRSFESEVTFDCPGWWSGQFSKHIVHLLYVATELSKIFHQLLAHACPLSALASEDEGHLGRCFGLSDGRWFQRLIAVGDAEGSVWMVLPPGSECVG